MWLACEVILIGGKHANQQAPGTHKSQSIKM